MIAASIAAAAAAAPHHTTLTYSASEFVSQGFANPTELVSFSAALPWSNVPVLEARLAAASDPASPTYAAWMTGAEVNALTAPPAAARPCRRRRCRHPVSWWCRGCVLACLLLPLWWRRWRRCWRRPPPRGLFAL